MTSPRKSPKQRALRSRIGSVIAYAVAAAVGAFLLYLAFAGYGFGAGRGSLSSIIHNHDRAIQVGRVPFSASQLVWIPLGLALLSPLAILIAPRRKPLRAYRIVVGALVASALACIVVEIVWVATGKPPQAYSVGVASPIDYLWPILGLAALAVIFASPLLILARRGRPTTNGRR